MGDSFMAEAVVAVVVCAVSIGVVADLAGTGVLPVALPALVALLMSVALVAALARRVAL